jgi:hypothetical protein
LIVFGGGGRLHFASRSAISSDQVFSCCCWVTQPGTIHICAMRLLYSLFIISGTIFFKLVPLCRSFLFCPPPARWLKQQTADSWENCNCQAMATQLSPSCSQQRCVHKNKHHNNKRPKVSMHGYGICGESGISGGVITSNTSARPRA